MPIAALLPLLLPLIPGVIDSMVKIYQSAVSDPETPEQVRAHYAQIAAALEAANLLVQNTPLPPPGSGR